MSTCWGGKEEVPSSIRIWEEKYMVYCLLNSIFPKEWVGHKSNKYIYYLLKNKVNSQLLVVILLTKYSTCLKIFFLNCLCFVN